MFRLQLFETKTRL